MLSGVCIFLTLYLFYRFTEIQKSNQEVIDKLNAVQSDMKALLDAYPLPSQEDDGAQDDPQP